MISDFFSKNFVLSHIDCKDKTKKLSASPHFTTNALNFKNLIFSFHI